MTGALPNGFSNIRPKPENILIHCLPPNYTFYPLTGNSNNMGVIAVNHTTVFTQGEEQFWEAFISQISGKFEREFLRDAAKKAYILNESDKLYKTLFNSISHELRIPVATIMGASDTLLSQHIS